MSLVLQLLLVALWFLLLLVRCHYFYLRGIGIVGEELAELQRYDLLDELFLVDILKVTVDVLHEGTYLLIVDIGLHNLVHHLVELFLADLLCRRDFRLDECLADLLLDVTDLVFLSTVDDGNRGALLASTASTA